MVRKKSKKGKVSLKCLLKDYRLCTGRSLKFGEGFFTKLKNDAKKVVKDHPKLFTGIGTGLVVGGTAMYLHKRNAENAQKEKEKIMLEYKNQEEILKKQKEELNLQNEEQRKALDANEKVITSHARAAIAKIDEIKSEKDAELSNTYIRARKHTYIQRYPIQQKRIETFQSGYNKWVRGKNGTRSNKTTKQLEIQKRLLSIYEKLENYDKHLESLEFKIKANDSEINRLTKLINKLKIEIDNNPDNAKDIIKQKMKYEVEIKELNKNKNLKQIEINKIKNDIISIKEDQTRLLQEFDEETNRSNEEENKEEIKEFSNLSSLSDFGKRRSRLSRFGGLFSSSTSKKFGKSEDVDEKEFNEDLVQKIDLFNKDLYYSNFITKYKNDTFKNNNLIELDKIKNYKKQFFAEFLYNDLVKYKSNNTGNSLNNYINTHKQNVMKKLEDYFVITTRLENEYTNLLYLQSKK